MNNLELWDKVKKTDPDYTKKVTSRGGYTSICAQYQIRCATEQFGAYGSGWGFESIDLDLSHVDLGFVLVKAVFFYELDGRHTFPINNSWAVGTGGKVDFDFAKKAETNTMSKALSKLGFSADIFMGEYDDPDYVQSVVDEFALEQAEDKIAEKERLEQERQQWVEDVLYLIDTSRSENELKKVFNGAVRRANLYKDQSSVIQFTKAKDAKKTEMEKNNV